jgi:rubrerythrin
MLEEVLHSLSKLKDQKSNITELSALIKKRIGEAEQPKTIIETLWNKESFGLDKVSVFNELDRKKQDDLLTLCSKMRLEEAYYIEYAGMSYAAKMSLLSTSVEEQKLYSLFAGEEARHFSYVTEFYVPEGTTEVQPFVEFLNNTIAHGSRMSLIFIVQVVLEGWGLDHYQKLVNHCSNKRFKKHLTNIIADEAGHHGSGVILFDTDKLNEKEYGFLIDVLSKFLHVVRIGPSSLISSLESFCGTFNNEALSKVYEELDAYNETKIKLSLLKRLMLKARGDKLVKVLEEMDLFTPKLGMK